METQTDKGYNEKQKRNKFLSFILNNKMTVFLFLIIIFLVVHSLIRINNLERAHNKEVTELKTVHELEMDSLTISKFQMSTEIFSWVIRSELVRNNKEEINHLFNSFIKTPRVTNIQLICPETFKVEISTDKKDEGMKVSDESLYDINKQVKKEFPEGIKFFNPVMGHNRILGIIVVTIRTEN